MKPVLAAAFLFAGRGASTTSIRKTIRAHRHAPLPALRAELPAQASYGRDKPGHDEPATRSWRRRITSSRLPEALSGAQSVVGAGASFQVSTLIRHTPSSPRFQITT